MRCIVQDLICLWLVILVSARASVFEQISWKLNLRYYFPPTLDVAAFNVQALGQSKSSDAKILEILGDIICRYDLIAIQEVRDAEHKVLSKLMDAVHNRCPKYKYGLRQSIRQGRTDLKEQLAFVYRQTSVSVIDTKTLGSGAFERPPFMGHFVAAAAPWFQFLIVAAHLQPKNALSELNALHRLFEMESRKFKGKISSALIMGDLKLVQSIYAHLPHKAFDSADGGYISATKLKDAKLFESSKFSWLIPTGMKTMVATNFTYDRIIAEKIYHESIVPGSANVFRYDNVIELRGKQPQEVSDHWPVHVRLLAKHFLPKQWHDDENSRNISIGIKDRSSRPTQSQRNGRNQKSGDKIQRNRKRTKPINQVISSPIHKSKASRRSSSRMRNSALRISVLEDCDEDEWTSDMD